MENPLLNTLSNSNISKNVNIKNNMSQTNTQLFNVSANLMPSERQTTIGVFNPSAVTKSNNEMKRLLHKEYTTQMEHHQLFLQKIFWFQKHYQLLFIHIILHKQSMRYFKLDY